MTDKLPNSPIRIVMRATGVVLGVAAGVRIAWWLISPVVPYVLGFCVAVGVLAGLFSFFRRR